MRNKVTEETTNSHSTDDDELVDIGTRSAKSTVTAPVASTSKNKGKFCNDKIKHLLNF